MDTPHQQLVALSRELGAEHRHLAILGEGNTSTRLGPESFLVKASGSSLGSLGEADLVECRFDVLLAALDAPGLSDAQVDERLLASRVDPQSKKPSVEAVFHAFLLSQPGVAWVGHTHPVAVNQILCSPRAADFAAHRQCPDEVICCGPASVLVPYTDPGLALARAIRAGYAAFAAAHAGRPPRVVLLENHGLIALGSSPAAVRAATFMAVKAAAIFTGAMALGGARPLAPADVHRLDHREDEEYRRRALQI